MLGNKGSRWVGECEETVRCGEAAGFPQQQAGDAEEVQQSLMLCNRP